MKKIILFTALFVSLTIAAQTDPCSKVMVVNDANGQSGFSAGTRGVDFQKVKVGEGAEFSVSFRAAYGEEKTAPLPAALILANGAKIERTNLKPYIFFNASTDSHIHNYSFTLTKDELGLLLRHNITARRLGDNDKDLTAYGEDLKQALGCVIDKQFQ